MSVMSILNHTGDVPIQWDPRIRVEVDIARETFARYRGAGYLAYTVDGAEREQIHEFDPHAEHIVMAPPTVGG